MDRLGTGEVNLASFGGDTLTGVEDSHASEELTEKISALKKRVHDIEGMLGQKLKELKETCLKEAVLTGTLPKEYPLLPGESAPRVRQRIGAAYKLDNIFPHADPYLSNLECRFAVQQKIVEAADRLAAETKGCKTLKKLRKKNCLNAMEKLKEAEEEINQYRNKMEKMSRQAPCPDDGINTSESSSLSDFLIPEDKEDTYNICTSEQRPQTVLEGLSENHLEWSSFQRNTQNSAGNHHSDKHFNRLKYNDTEDGMQHRPSSALVANRSPFRAPSGKFRYMCGISSENLTNLNSFRQACCRSQSRLEGKHQSSTLNCTIDLSVPRQSCTKQGKISKSCGSTPNLGCSPVCCPNHHALPQKPTIMYCIPGCSFCADPEFHPYKMCECDSDLEYLLTLKPSYHTPAYYGHIPQGQSKYEGKNTFLQTYGTMRSSHHRDFSGPKTEPMSRVFHRTLVLEHLQGWYHQSLGRLNNAHGLQAAVNYNKECKHILGYQTLPALRSHSKKVTSHTSVPSAAGMQRYKDRVTMGQTEYTTPVSVQKICPEVYRTVASSSPSRTK